MKLKFLMKSYKSDGYGGSNQYIRKGSELQVVSRFKHQLRNISHNPEYQSDPSKLLEKLDDRDCYISNKIRFGSQIMLMDVDYEDFKDETSKQLSDRGISHTIISSSEDRYWIIADVFKSNKYRMANALSEYVGVDPRYISSSRHRSFGLRAFPQKAYVPEVIERVGTGSGVYKGFVEAFEVYWKKPHIKWMVQEYLMNAI